MKIQRSIDSPIRDFQGMDHRWRQDDNGLIWCWELGRQWREEGGELPERASRGELIQLGWKGGVNPKQKTKKKKGTLKYLAQWQGLAGLDLDIDTEKPVTLTCSSTGVEVEFSKLGWK